MICVECQCRTQAVPCSECGREPRVDGRFALEGLLGAGAVGTTWRATGPGGQVALKELALRRARTPKSRQLIDREIRVLRELRHPAVPRLHEVVETGRGRGRTLWLVLDLVDGVPLHQVWRGPAPEGPLLEVIAKVAAVLRDLHALRPPVVHRDIKPANVLLRTDGSVALVDFGSVRDAVVGPVGSSTVVGTFGYSAPEQLQGEATPASDLYALGATAVHLLAGEPPHRLLDRAGHLRWRDAVHVSMGLGALLDDLLQADPAQRVSTADEVLTTIDWLLHVSGRRAGSQPSQVRTVHPASTTAPREAGRLVGVLQDAYDGKAPSPRPPTPTPDRASPPTGFADPSRPPVAQVKLDRTDLATRAETARMRQAVAFRLSVGAVALGAAALGTVALLLVVLPARVASMVPAPAAVAPGPARQASGQFLSAADRQAWADAEATIQSHPGSLISHTKHCPGGPGRPAGAWVTLNTDGSWSPPQSAGTEEETCLAEAAAGAMQGTDLRATPAALYVPLILGDHAARAGWVDALTTDGVPIDVELASGLVVSGGADVSVGEDGHISR